MSLLRIRASLADAPSRCQWALVDGSRDPLSGEGPLVDLPRRAGRVQLVIPAAQVLITRARLPQGARHHAGSALAYAVEDETVGDPEANQVSWLGAAGDDDVLAVVDKQSLARWRDALAVAGVRSYELHCETLLLPWATDEWNLAWNGREGFVRSGEFEGAATDCGERDMPPLSLRLMLEAAAAAGRGPTSIAIHTTIAEAAPDCEIWARELGIAVRHGGTWDWRTAPPGSGVALTQERQRWRVFAGAATRLRPAAWLLGAALSLHAVALFVDWTSLANEQRALRQQMESRFRAVFPDAVAVAAPALQMRRNLAAARHAAGQPDSGDFLPLSERVAAAAKELPAGAVRALSYDGGRMTLEIIAVDEDSVRRMVARLRQSDLNVDTMAPVAPRAAGVKRVLTVWTS